MIVHIKRNTANWETLQVASVEEAMSKIKEVHPHAVNGHWQPDLDGSPPAGLVMHVWQGRRSYDRKLPPVALIRKSEDSPSDSIAL